MEHVADLSAIGDLLRSAGASIGKYSTNYASKLVCSIDCGHLYTSYAERKTFSY
jgi:hypothetical protein